MYFIQEVKMNKKMLAVSMTMALSMNCVLASDELSMDGFNLVPGNDAVEARSDAAEDRDRIMSLLHSMNRIDEEVDRLISQGDALDKKAHETIMKARRQAATSRTAGNLLSLAVGVGGAASTHITGERDTSESWNRANNMYNANNRYANYAGNRRINSAVGNASVYSNEASMLKGRAGILENERMAIQRELDEFVIPHLRLVNNIVSNIRGIEETSLGKVKDLAYNPEAGKDLSYDGAMIYSLTFILDDKPVDIRLTDLDKLIDDNFSALISEREADLKSAKELVPEAFIKSLKEKIEAREEEIAGLKTEKKETGFFSSERKAINKKLSHAKSEKSDLQSQYKRMTSKRGREALNNQAGNAERAIKMAEKLLARAKNAQEVLSKLNKEDVEKAIEEIRELI